MSTEQRYYENREHWDITKYEGPEMQRMPILAKMIPKGVTSILDVGCGNGLFLRHLDSDTQHKFTRLCGMDRSTAALAHVVGEKVKGSIDALPFQDREFDMLTSTEVLEHLPQDIYNKAKLELSRVAKTWIMITVPYDERIELSQTTCTLCKCKFNPNYHLRSFNERDVHQLFLNYGFICRDIFKIYPQNKVPDSIERVIQTLGTITRTLLAHSPASMRSNTICPACGHETQRGNEQTRIIQNPQTMGMRLRSLLCIKQTHRWIGAVYERQ